MKDLKKMTFAELAEVVVFVWAEVKRRNPIFVNSYESPFVAAVMNLREIGEAEKDNFTCEAGPGVDKPKKGPITMTNILHICTSSEHRRQAMGNYRAMLGDLVIYNLTCNTVKIPGAGRVIHLVILTNRGVDEIDRVRGCVFNDVIGDVPQRYATLIAALSGARRAGPGFPASSVAKPL